MAPADGSAARRVGLNGCEVHSSADRGTVRVATGGRVTVAVATAAGEASSRTGAALTTAVGAAVGAGVDSMRGRRDTAITTITTAAQVAATRNQSHGRDFRVAAPSMSGFVGAADVGAI